jgi:cyanate lyase
MAKGVAELCQEQQLTTQGLTDRSGLDEGRVLAIIMGRWTPSPQERKKIAEALGSQTDEISWGHKTPIQHIYGHGPG